MSEESEEIAQGEYAWLKIESPDDYDRLVDFLDAEFEPEAIARELKNNITSEVSSVLVEHDYIDKDYRSTFYNFYAKMGRPYRQDCVRLHFFDREVAVLHQSPDKRGVPLPVKMVSQLTQTWHSQVRSFC